MVSGWYAWNWTQSVAKSLPHVRRQRARILRQSRLVLQTLHVPRVRSAKAVVHLSAVAGRRAVSRTNHILAATCHRAPVAQVLDRSRGTLLGIRRAETI